MQPKFSIVSKLADRSLKKPNDDIPQTKSLRNRMRRIVAEYVQQNNPLGPL